MIDVRGGAVDVLTVLLHLGGALWVALERVTGLLQALRPLSAARPPGQGSTRLHDSAPRPPSGVNSPLTVVERGDP